MQEHVTKYSHTILLCAGVLAGMCRSVVQSSPEQGLATLLPLLVDRIAAKLPGPDTGTEQADGELQYLLQLLGEVLCCSDPGVSDIIVYSAIRTTNFSDRP